MFSPNITCLKVHQELQIKNSIYGKWSSFDKVQQFCASSQWFSVQIDILSQVKEG